MIATSIDTIWCCSVYQYYNATIESIFSNCFSGVGMRLAVTIYVIENVNSIARHGHTLGYPFYGPRGSEITLLQCHIQETKVTSGIFVKHFNIISDIKDLYVTYLTFEVSQVSEVLLLHAFKLLCSNYLKCYM